MITPIARKVQSELRAVARAGGPEITVEIIFPVAAEAIATTDDLHLPIVPGVAGGEGCSTAGGCATCPYMKMSSLDALLGVLERIANEPASALAGYAPKHYSGAQGGAEIAELGTRSILRMRAFQTHRALPAELVTEITTQP